MDTFIIEDRKTIPVDDFEGLSFAMQRFEGLSFGKRRQGTWSSLGHAIRHGIHRNH
jgi:hypothetical protein